MVDVLSSLPFVGEFFAESAFTPAILTATSTVPLFLKHIKGLVKTMIVLGSVAGLGLFFVPKLTGKPESGLNAQYLEAATKYAEKYAEQNS